MIERFSSDVVDNLYEETQNLVQFRRERFGRQRVAVKETMRTRDVWNFFLHKRTEARFVSKHRRRSVGTDRANDTDVQIMSMEEVFQYPQDVFGRRSCFETATEKEILPNSFVLDVPDECDQLTAACDIC